MIKFLCKNKEKHIIIKITHSLISHNTLLYLHYSNYNLHLNYRITTKEPRSDASGLYSIKRRLPTLPLVRSTIGVTKLNFSVRNGKR